MTDFHHRRKENISTRQSGWNEKKEDIYSIWATVDPTQSVDPSSPTSAPPHSVSSTVLTVLTWCYTAALIIIILIIFPLNVSIDNPIIYLFAHLLLYLALLLEYLFSNFQTPASIVNFLSFLEWQIWKSSARLIHWTFVRMYTQFYHSSISMNQCIIFLMNKLYLKYSCLHNNLRQ